MTRAVVCALTVVLSVPGFAQGDPTLSGGGELSPRVVATWEARSIPGGSLLAGPWTLNVLVLWRGKPDWVTTGATQSGSPLFAGPGSDHTHVVWVRGREVTLRFDPGTKTARLQNQVIPLEGVNVVLVDDVDGTPRVAGTAWVEPEFPTDVEPTEALVRRSPLLTEFVQFTP
jgi:hypothetical protein